jgi:hypothetical protein
MSEEEFTTRATDSSRHGEPRRVRNSFIPRRELPNMVAHRPILICPAASSRCSRKDDQTDHPDSTKARNPPHDFILEPEAALVAPSPPNRRTCQPALVAARTRYAPAWSESANPSRGGYLGPRLGRHDQPLSARPTDPVKRRVHRCAMKRLFLAKMAKFLPKRLENPDFCRFSHSKSSILKSYFGGPSGPLLMTQPIVCRRRISLQVSETSEVTKLFERIAMIEKDLDPKRTGKVFNVLGEVFPSNQLEKMLRDIYAHNQMTEELIKQRIVEQVDPEHFRSITNSTLEGLAKRWYVGPDPELAA